MCITKREYCTNLPIVYQLYLLSSDRKTICCYICLPLSCSLNIEFTRDTAINREICTSCSLHHPPTCGVHGNFTQSISAILPQSNNCKEKHKVYPTLCLSVTWIWNVRFYNICKAISCIRRTQICGATNNQSPVEIIEVFKL